MAAKLSDLHKHSKSQAPARRILNTHSRYFKEALGVLIQSVRKIGASCRDGAANEQLLMAP